MLTWILVILGVGLVLIILALVLPVIVSGCVSGGTGAKFAYTGTVRGFGGIAGFGITYDGTNNLFSLAIGSRLFGKINIQPYLARVKRRKPAAKKPARKKKEVSIRERIPQTMGQFRYFWPFVKRGIRELWYIVHIDRFAASVTFGFANPALMGKLIGIIAAVNAVLPAPFSISQSFDFRTRVAQGELDVRVTIVMHRFWKVVFGYIPLLWSVAREQRKRRQESVIQKHDHFITQEVA